MTAETAMEAGESDTARKAYEKIVSDFADSEFVPRAKDGLAFLAWNENRLEDALKGYEELTQKWPSDSSRGVPIPWARFSKRSTHRGCHCRLSQAGNRVPRTAVATKSDRPAAKAHPDLFPAEGEGEAPADAGAVSAGDAAQTEALTVGTPAVAAEGE